MNGFKFRPAAPGDAEQLRLLNDEFNGGDADASHIARSLSENPREIVCVAQIENELAGFCCVQVFASMCYMDPCAEITELYVREDFRRMGAAAGLMGLVEKMCAERGARRIHLLTGNKNYTAQALYRALGYASGGEMYLEKELKD